MCTTLRRDRKTFLWREKHENGEGQTKIFEGSSKANEGGHTLSTCGMRRLSRTYTRFVRMQLYGKGSIFPSLRNISATGRRRRIHRLLPTLGRPLDRNRTHTLQLDILGRRVSMHSTVVSQPYETAVKMITRKQSRTYSLQSRLPVAQLVRSTHRWPCR